MPVMHGSLTSGTAGNVPDQIIRIDPDGPLDDGVILLIRKAVQEARGGAVTHLIDGEWCVAEIRPPAAEAIVRPMRIGTAEILVETVPEPEAPLDYDSLPVPQQSFREALTELVNSQCREDASNTPDYLLAQFLTGSLEIVEELIRTRDRWYSVHLSPGNSHFSPTGVFEPNIGEIAYEAFHASSERDGTYGLPTWSEVDQSTKRHFTNSARAVQARIQRRPLCQLTWDAAPEWHWARTS